MLAFFGETMCPIPGPGSSGSGLALFTVFTGRPFLSVALKSTDFLAVSAATAASAAVEDCSSVPSRVVVVTDFLSFETILRRLLASSRQFWWTLQQLMMSMKDECRGRLATLPNPKSALRAPLPMS